MKFVSSFLLMIFITAPVFGAKVIMKDGKIYEGKIVAESDGDVLIKTTPFYLRPVLLPHEDVLSVVRDPPPPADPADLARYISTEMLLTGNLFSSSQISLDPAPGLWLGCGLRFVPWAEVGAGFDWKPAMSGDLSVSDGTTTRSYESFYSYGGGFSAKVYPFYRFKSWRAEPYLTGGYTWNRLVPKASGDALKGGGYHAGLGASWPLGKRLFLLTEFLYRHIEYDRIFFLLRQGTLNPPVRTDSFSLATGLALRW